MTSSAPASDADPLKLGNFLCFAIYAAGHAFSRAYKPYLDPLGLTYPQFLVMVALWENNDQTVSSLASRLHLESNTLTPLLKRLEAAGLVNRRRDPDDERQVRVSLTEKGAAMREQAATIPECMAGAIGLDLEAIKRLQSELTELRERLEATR